MTLPNTFKSGERRSLSSEEVINRFGYHKGTEFTIPQHTDLRQEFILMATYLDRALPEGRAKSIAMTELESCAMWANKAIAEMAPVKDEYGTD